jgi:hypothetical protein
VIHRDQKIAFPLDLVLFVELLPGGLAQALNVGAMKFEFGFVAPDTELHFIQCVRGFAFVVGLFLQAHFDLDLFGDDALFRRWLIFVLFHSGRTASITSRSFTS